MRPIILTLALLSICLANAVPALGADSAADKIQRALAAAPASIQAGATVMDADMHGKMTVLRKGTNGFTCFPGHPGVVGDDAMCADAQAMMWARDWMAHKPKPSNTAPGIVYMLSGGTDWSADDPWATKGTPIHEPPHWMIMWPYDPKTSGLSNKFSTTGTWIMDSGTPYAHLMINQKP
jgi:hypothetical protein